MREILFKAKRKDNGEWVEGALFYSYNNKTAYIIVQSKMTEVFDDGMGGFDALGYEVCPDTICQYTGLIDKNGKKIWENDFVREMDFRYLGMIKYVDAGYQIKWNDSYIRSDINFWVKERCLNVVGNSFDNPELLGD